MALPRLRPARADDAAALVAIEAAATSTRSSEAAWRDLIEAAENGTMVVAERDDRPVGVVACEGPDDPRSTGHVTRWYVHPDGQGTGVGRALLVSARRLLRHRGCTSARAAVPAEAQRALTVLAADGWRTVGAGAGIVLLEHRLPDDEPYLVENRDTWNQQAADYVQQGADAWAGAPRWGVFGIPEARVGILPDDLTGADVVELGCGTGYVSAWCLQRGARRAIGVDNSPEQLATAVALARQHGAPLHVVLANAEECPLADASFDLAISEYGAAIWCDPHRWVPEAARLLRPGGTLVLFGNSALVMLCVQDFEDQPIGPRLVRPQRGMRRFDWADSPGVEFHVSHGEMIRILRSAGFEVLDLVELYAERDATTRYAFVDAEWASQWPVEEAWIARRR